MKTDPLQDLLSRADSAAPAPVMAAGLADRVLRRAHRRIVRRNALALLAVLFACGLAISISRRPRSDGTRPPLSPPQWADGRAELARLDADAQRELLIVADLQRIASPKSSPPRIVDDPTGPDALARVDEARNRTALILLRQADRAASDPETRDQASGLYMRTVHLFPATPAGRVAAERLKST
jgi:hypothetical protein